MPGGVWFTTDDGFDLGVATPQGVSLAKTNMPVETSPGSVGYLNSSGEMVGEIFAMTPEEMAVLRQNHNM